MKEVKAYIRQDRLPQIIGRLDGGTVRISARIFRMHWEKYSSIAKIEIAGAVAQVDRFVNIRTGVEGQTGL